MEARKAFSGRETTGGGNVGCGVGVLAGVEVGKGLGVWVKVGSEGRTAAGEAGGRSNKSASGVDKTTIEEPKS